MRDEKAFQKFLQNITTKNVFPCYDRKRKKDDNADGFYSEILTLTFL